MKTLRGPAWMWWGCLASMSAALAAEKTWVGGSSWQDPAAWSPAGVPELLDDVVIGGGVVSLPGEVIHGGRLTWTGGQIQGGLLRLPAGSELRVEGEADKTLFSTAVSSAGVVQVRGAGSLKLLFTGYNQSLAFTNEPGGVVELHDAADVVQSNAGGWPPGSLAFVNSGVLRKLGTGTNLLSGVGLVQDGAVEVAAGRLRWEGGGSGNGRFSVAAGAGLDLSRGAYHLNGATFEGEGPVRIRGDLTLRGVFTASNFGLAAGTLEGDADVSGRFEWTGGTVARMRLRLGTGSHRIEGREGLELHAATFLNAGQLTLDGASVGIRFTGYNQSVLVTNEPGATLVFAGDSRLEQRNPGGWPPASLALVNGGTLRSVGPGTNAVVDVPLHNAGVVDVVSGTFRQGGGGSGQGTWSVGEGAGAEWVSGSYALSGARMTGAGALRSAGVVTLNGDLAAERFEVVGGTLSGNCRIEGGFAWTGGGLTGLNLRLGPGHHSIRGADPKEILGATVSNEGHMVMEDVSVGARFTAYGQAVLITNAPAAIWEMRGTPVLEQRNAGGWPPVALGFHNQGTLRKTGEGRAQVMAIPLHSAGRVEGVAGTLSQTGGGSFGGIGQLGPGTALEVGTGTYALGGSRWEGGGALRVVSSATVQGSFHAERFVLGGGDLGGNFEVSGGFEWSAGRLQGAGVRLGPGQHRVAGNAEHALLNSTVANAGTLSIDAATVAVQFTGYNQLCLWTNEPGAVLVFAGGAGLVQVNAGGWPPAALKLVNAGTLRMEGPGTNVLSAIPIDNGGLMHVVSGTGWLDRGGTSPGEFRIDAGARLEVRGGTHQLEGSRWLGAGTAAVNGGVTFSGSFESEALELESGTLGGTMEIRRGFRWSGGELVSAQVRLGAGTHRIFGAGTKNLLDATVRNAGVLKLEGATLGMRFTGWSQADVLENLPGGILELSGGVQVVQVNAGGWPPAQVGVFNSGTMRALRGAEHRFEAVPLRNLRRLEVPGELRSTATIELMPEGTAVLGVGASPALSSSGTISLAGVLEASTAPGQKIVPGQEFTVIRAGALNGSFGGAVAANPGHVHTYDVRQTMQEVLLTARSVLTEPVAMNSVELADGTFRFRVQAPPGLRVRLESSTNLMDWTVEWESTVSGAFDVEDPRALADGVRVYRIGLYP